MIIYEWDIESTDEHGDIVDHNHSDTCPGLSLKPGQELVLVRDVFNDEDSLQDRQWAYVQRDGTLPEFFDGGARVPKRFHYELAKASR